MLKLSIKTEQLLKAVFPVEQQDEARDLIEIECGRNIPSCENATAEGIERIRFSVLKISEGDLDKLYDAIDLAQIDWRDVLMEAGFDNDTKEHERWYRTLI
jgi:hypothetical protein